MTKVNLVKERAWLERKLRQNRIGVLLWNIKSLIYEIDYYDIEDLFPSLPFSLPSSNLNLIQNKRGTKTLIPIITDLDGSNVLVWAQGKNEFWVWAENGKRVKCSWFQDKEDGIIKLWITNSLHYLKKNLESSLFEDEAKELKGVVSELEFLMFGTRKEKFERNDEEA